MTIPIWAQKGGIKYKYSNQEIEELPPKYVHEYFKVASNANAHI